MDILQQSNGIERTNNISEVTSEYLNKYCNIIIAKDLKTKIDSMDEFIKGKRSLKSCLYGKSMTYLHLLPQIFCSFDDMLLDDRAGKLLLNQDLDGIDIEKIKIIEAPDNLSKQNLFKEIRDAIEHKHMYFRRGKLFIRNPKNNTNHKYDFEAEIPSEVLMDFIFLSIQKKRGIQTYQYRYKGHSISSNMELVYEKEKGNIRFYEGRSKGKNHLIISTNQESDEEYIKRMVGSVELREIELSPLQKDILSEYFEKNKCCSGNLSHACNHLLRHDLADRDMLLRTLILENKKFEEYSLNEFLSDKEVRKFLTFGHIDQTMFLENNVLLELSEKLRTTYQKDGHHILEYFDRCLELCLNFLKNKGYKGDKNGKFFYNESERITFGEVGSLIDSLMHENININNGILEFPNRLRVQMLKIIYVNGLITGIDSEEDRHIRNSLAHNRYTILQGVDKIILRDGYSKTSNRYSREKMYDLKNFFDSKYQEMLNQNNVNENTESQMNAAIFMLLVIKDENLDLMHELFDDISSNISHGIYDY